MDIGEPLRVIIVEPMEDPVPGLMALAAAEPVARSVDVSDRAATYAFRLIALGCVVGWGIALLGWLK